MLTVFGALIVVMVVLNSVLFRRKAGIPAEPEGRHDKGMVAQSEDDPGKTLMRRARYILRQNTEDRALTSASPQPLQETSRLSWSPHLPEADPEHPPVSEEAVDTIAEPEKTSSPFPVDTRSPGLAENVAAGELPEPATVVRRPDTIGQQAMSYAMRNPEPGKRGVKNTEVSVLADTLGIKKRSLNDRVYKARLVLRYNKEAVPLVMDGTLSLWKAFDKALEFKRRKNAETIEPREAARLRSSAAWLLEQNETAVAA
jgi:hypothetical protein